MKKILLVEDDAKLSQHLIKLITTEGLAPRHVADPSELQDVLESEERFDLVVLDRLIGSLDTKSRLREIKRKWPAASVLVLSAINTPIERAELINLGVDDYMGKPFLAQELLARIKSLTRRLSSHPETYRQIGNSVLDLMRRTISVGDKADSLPAKEFLLLRILSDEVGRVVSKNELLDVVWGMTLGAETNVVEATVTHLRKRLNTLGSELEIKNMRNSGYWLEI